jgi:hypothetical protein
MSEEVELPSGFGQDDDFDVDLTPLGLAIAHAQLARTTKALAMIAEADFGKLCYVLTVEGRRRACCLIHVIPEPVCPACLVGLMREAAKAGIPCECSGDPGTLEGKLLCDRHSKEMREELGIKEGEDAGGR